MRFCRCIYLLLFSIILFSCGSESSFIYLKNHTLILTEADSLMYNAKPKGNKLQEFVLIKNPSPDTSIMKRKMLAYFDSLFASRNTDKLLSRSEVFFYQYSSNTAPFVESERKYKLLSREYIYDQMDDYIGKVVYTKFIDTNSQGLFLLYYQDQVDTFHLK